MSAYITLATPMTDEECLVAALGDLGFARTVLELRPEGAPLVGYEGRSREQRAHVIVRRQHVGAASNDLGFERTPTGYRAHVSGYDHPRYGAGWLTRLNERYHVHSAAKLERLAAEERRREEERRERERAALVEAQRQAVHEKARKLGYRVEETREGAKIRLVLVKRVY